MHIVMIYDIRAWLDHTGTPRLQIIDIDSGEVRIDWSADRAHSRAVKSLFRRLMLLSVRDKLVGRRFPDRPEP